MELYKFLKKLAAIGYVPIGIPTVQTSDEYGKFICERIQRGHALPKLALYWFDKGYVQIISEVSGKDIHSIII